MKFADVSDAEFERLADKIFGEFKCSKIFYAKIAGAGFPNPDGSSRIHGIEDCELGDGIEFRPEPENSFDPNAVAVYHRKDGRQLGYLEKRLAAEVARDFREYGPCWVAIFRHPSHNPETGKVAGGVIYMLRLPVEELTEEESKAE
jgi:hypothetical protein